MSIDEILSRFERVRRHGAGWIALCPAHADKNPSLSIGESDGKILLHCYAGCTPNAICAAVGIPMRDLFAPRVVDEYRYVDEDDKLLYVVERREPKGFRQRRPDGKGGWIWNLDGKRRVLFHLPEVLEAEFIIIVEGERDVESARKLGFVATCNPGGAGKWRGEYSDPLRGKRVAIIADADEPGRKHAQQVAASLAGEVQSLKVMELPGAKDLTEWLVAGGNRQALEGFIEIHPEWMPPKSVSANRFALMPLGDLLARPDTSVDYVLENHLVAGGVSGVFAKPKVGKSTFARNLCLAVARGEDFLGFKTKKGECIYLALEEREEDIRQDFRAMGADGSEPIYVHAASAPVEGIAALCDLVRERKPILVVIDPLFRLARIRDEKAYAETYTALGPLIDVAREIGTHVLFTHHAGKGMKADAVDSPLGSTAIGGVVSTLLVLKRTSNRRTIETVQRVGVDIPGTVLEFDSNTRRLALGKTRFDSERQDGEMEILEFLESANGPQTQEQIRDGVEGQTRVIRAALTALVAAGRVDRAGDGKKGRPFLYAFPNSGSEHIAGTRKPEYEGQREVTEKNGRIPVPQNSQTSLVVSDIEQGDDEVRL